MEVQYSLPLSTTPFVDLAENMGRDAGEVIRRLKHYFASGVLKRCGLNLNYRALSSYRRAALVGLRAENFERVAEIINRHDEFRVKHNFLRDDFYNVWFTIKGRDVEEIRTAVETIALEAGINEYIILPTKRIYKMDVKYDLYRGVSWSERGLEPENVPKLSELGFDEGFVRSLESLEIAERPFLGFEYGEEEVVDIIEELMERGVGRDFSGVLRERKVGFRENGMTVVRTEKVKRVAMLLLDTFPQITHLIERVVDRRWNYPLYFMVHAVRRDPIERIRERVLNLEDVEDARTIYSRANLREA